MGDAVIKPILACSDKGKSRLAVDALQAGWHVETLGDIGVDEAMQVALVEVEETHDMTRLRRRHPLSLFVDSRNSEPREQVDLVFDAVRGAAEGEIESVTMVTRKPPSGLEGAPHLVENDIDVSDLSAPLKVFDGTARAAVKGFPANVNVAVALSLAGVGPDRTTIEVWADPGVTRNTHTIKVEADSVRFEMTIENVPSAANPRTGMLTPLSTIAALRGLVSPLKVGT